MRDQWAMNHQLQNESWMSSERIRKAAHLMSLMVSHTKFFVTPSDSQPGAKTERFLLARSWPMKQLHDLLFRRAFPTK